MKTIEERAKEYEKSTMTEAASECRLAFIRGAQSERAELTRWRDPKKELPEGNTNVIIRYLADKEGICTGCYNSNKERWELNDAYLCHLSNRVYIHVLAWREIHENEK